MVCLLCVSLTAYKACSKRTKTILHITNCNRCCREMPNSHELFCKRCKKMLQRKMERKAVSFTIFSNLCLFFSSQFETVGETPVYEEPAYQVHFIQWQYQVAENQWENYHESTNQIIESRFGVCIPF